VAEIALLSAGETMTQATHIPGNTPAAPHNPHVPLRTYYIVFAALMVLLGATVVAAFLPQSMVGGFGIVIALLIATAKAAMVVWIFMHVKYSSPLTKLFVISGFIWLAIMFVFTFADYFTRAWLPSSAGWTDNPIRAERYLPPTNTTVTGAHPPGH